MNQSTTPLWKKIWLNNISSLEEVCKLCQIDPSSIGTEGSFSINIPRRLFCKIGPSPLHDPIFRQFVPSKEEGTGRGVIDPLKERSTDCVGCLIKKYANRVLLGPSPACAMHCRYCFRKHTPLHKPSARLMAELSYIQQHTDIAEVILSGGDPLSSSNKTLASFLTALSNIQHVKRLRIHTRFPIGIPERIDAELLHILHSCRLQIIIVIHINHTSELDDDIRHVCTQLQQIGCLLFSQTVLLRTINDSVPVLKNLFENITAAKIIPYYLHAFDNVKGVTHFKTPRAKGIEIMKQLHTILPGYMLPRFVKEIFGDPGKRIISFMRHL